MSDLINKLKELDKQATPVPWDGLTLSQHYGIPSIEAELMASLRNDALPQLIAALEVVEAAKAWKLDKISNVKYDNMLASIRSFDTLSLDKDGK